MFSDCIGRDANVGQSMGVTPGLRHWSRLETANRERDFARRDLEGDFANLLV